MTRIVTFGQQPSTPPAGNFRQIIFPEMARLDTGTKEGMVSRVLSGDGGNTRDLPRTIYFQQAQQGGHAGGVASGSLHEITMNGETGLVSGKGWIADTPEGRNAAMNILAKSLFHNSIDLGDIGPSDVRIVEHGDFWDDDFWVEIVFDQWSVIATTLVGKPAFGGANSQVLDEILAALEDDTPLVVDCPSYASAHSAVEIAAGALALPAWELFHRAEADIPHSLIVGVPDADGWIPVYGHLAQWNKPHRGYDGRTVFAPRPQKAYREFNRPGVLSSKGQVETGPIVLYGGHVSLADACNDPRNAWADVRVVAGKHGPWLSGVVRPHIAQDDAETYVARASQISGHWKGTDLCMIVSCNVEGFNIEGRGVNEPLGPDELVASFTPDTEPGNVTLPRELLSFTELSTETQEAVMAMVRANQSTGTALNGLPPYGTTSSIETTEAATVEVERQRMLLEAELDDEDADAYA